VDYHLFQVSRTSSSQFFYITLSVSCTVFTGFLEKQKLIHICQQFLRKTDTALRIPRAKCVRLNLCALKLAYFVLLGLVI